MRLDAYLKSTRLVPRRSEAGELCRHGKVLVNGQPAKAGRAVRVGDTLCVTKPGRELTVRVLALPAKKSVSKAEARELYETEGERRFDFWGVEIPARKPRHADAGDPSGTGETD
jgi:ribosomal 50S subunit-recycling heat shock protein